MTRNKRSNDREEEGNGKRRKDYYRSTEGSSKSVSAMVCLDPIHEDHSKIKSIEDDKVSDFIIDSGAARHMLALPATSHLGPTTSTCRVQVADGRNIDAFVKDDVPFDVINNTSGDAAIVLRKPLLVPSLSKNLFLIAEANKNGYDVACLTSGEVLITKDGETVPSTPPTNKDVRIPRLKASSFRTQNEFNLGGSTSDDNDVVHHAMVASTTNEFDLVKFHNEMGHPGPKKMKALLKKHFPELNVTKELIVPCMKCKAGKMNTRALKTAGHEYPLLGLKHTDVCGPINVPTFGGRKYILNFLDDHSKFCVSVLLRNKDSEAVVTAFKYFVAFAERTTGQKVIRLRSNQGTEFKNESMTTFCQTSGIVQEYSNVYSPRQNGNAERINLTFWNITRTMLLASKLPRQLWGEIHLHVVYLYNH